MSVTLLLLRHGQIKANRQRRWHGSTDSALTLKAEYRLHSPQGHYAKEATFTQPTPVLYSVAVILAHWQARIQLTGQP